MRSGLNPASSLEHCLSLNVRHEENSPQHNSARGVRRRRWSGIIWRILASRVSYVGIGWFGFLILSARLCVLDFNLRERKGLKQHKHDFRDHESPKKPGKCIPPPHFWLMLGSFFEKRKIR